jgi:glutaminyl-tRNA synthetase
MKMRDPPLVRIKHAHHYRTGEAWCIYPLYDYAHCLEDSFEGVTHSICTLEFESARELYDWVIQATEVPHVPRQYEFARLNLGYTVMSKRKLLQLVEQKHVKGWDDPRMPTLAGMRRRGYTPEAIREFCARIGVAKNISTVDMALLESCVRDDLDRRCPRAMGVLRPVALVVTSYAEGEVEELEAPSWPEGTEPDGDVPAARRGNRKLAFSRTLWIDEEDFAETPPAGWKRLAPGREVRLRHAYIVTCTGVVKDASGKVVEVHCTHDASTRGGAAPAGKKVDGAIHWVSAGQALDAEVRLYDRLCKVEAPGEGGRDFLEDLNPASLKVVKAKVERSLASLAPRERLQLERVGFFVVDEDSAPGALVLNRTVALKDAWARAVARAEPSKAEPKAAKPAKSDGDKKPAAAPQPLSEGAKALADAHGLPAEEARVLDATPGLGRLFADVASSDAGKAHARAVSAVLVNDVLGELRARKIETTPFDGHAVLELAMLVADATISSKQGKDVLAEMFASGKGARAIVLASGMKQIASADALGPIVDAVLAENEDAVARYKAGNKNVLGALVGLAMKKSKGQANPKLLTELLTQKLG